MAASKPVVWWPLDSVAVTGAWGNSPAYYAQFGQRGHNGIDLAASLGTPVYAADSGRVLMEGWNTSWSGVAGGISVIIQHGWGYSGYAHLNTTIIDAGQAVSKGQLIGYSGMTGVGTGPHLHFETFPPSVNFANGFSGRVNPDSIVTLQARGGSASPVTEQDEGMKSITHRDESGSIYFAGPFGYYHLPDLGTGFKGVSELVYAAEIFSGMPMIQVNNRQRDLINSWSRNYWNAARAQIAADVAARTPAATVDHAALTKTITDAIKAQGVSVDTAAIAKAVDAALKDDFAAVPDAAIDSLKRRL